jgi:signal transduction histidine kinase
MDSSSPRASNWGSIAFGIVMLGGYLIWLTGGGLQSDLPRLVTVTLLGVSFWGLGTWGEERIHQLDRRWLTAAYFAVQLPIGAGISFLTNGSTYLILLPLASQAVERLPTPWALGVCAAVYAILVAPLTILNGIDGFWNWGAPILAAVAFVAAFTQITVSEQKARLELAKANQKLREYAARIEEVATIQERNRLAREIHDGLGHYLTAINIQIKAAQARMGQDPAQAKEALGNAQNLAQEALADVRRSISALRADPSTNRPLPETLESLLEETRSAGLEASLDVQGTPTPLPPQVDFTLYRAAQEGLTNVRKHAHASRVELCLSYGERAVSLRVQDNGSGAASQADGDGAGGFGLTGLQERVDLLGGILMVETSPGRGFSLKVELPRIPKGT